MDVLIGQVHIVDALPINYCARTRQVKVEVHPHRYDCMSNPVLPVDSSFYLFIFRFCFLFCTEKMEESDVQRPSPEHVRIRLFNWNRKTLQLRAHAPSQSGSCCCSWWPTFDPFSNTSPADCVDGKIFWPIGEVRLACHELYNPKRVALIIDIEF